MNNTPLMLNLGVPTLLARFWRDGGPFVPIIRRPSKVVILSERSESKDPYDVCTPAGLKGTAALMPLSGGWRQLWYCLRPLSRFAPNSEARRATQT